MKKFTIILLFSLESLSLLAQFSLSSWKGTVRGDNPRNAILNFQKDTLLLLAISDSSLIETMTYSVKDMVLTLQKVDGQSDCDNSTIGKYKLSIEKGTLTVKMIADPCEDRSAALDRTKWQKWNAHPEVHIDKAILQQYIGDYEFDAGHHIFITLEKGYLQAEGPNNNLPKSILYPESNSRFFLKVAGVEIDFVKDDKGKVTKMISHEEQDHDLKKIK
jgi:Domain of unknown function (DUF3471)